MRVGRGQSPSLAGKRHAFRTSSARRSRPFAHALVSSTCASRAERMLLIFLLNPTVSSQPHSRFHSGGVIHRYTLRISRERSLTVPDHQRYVRKCIFFSAPPVGRTCSSVECLAQPFVWCSSTAFQPFLGASAGAFRQRLTMAAVAFTF